MTHVCDWPPAARKLPKVTCSPVPLAAASRQIDQQTRQALSVAGGIYSLNLSLLADLRPDLIVAQSLCGVCAVSEEEVRVAAAALPSRPRIVNLAPTQLSDLFVVMRQLGGATGCQERAEREIAALESRITAVAQRSARIPDRCRGPSSPR